MASISAEVRAAIDAAVARWAPYYGVTIPAGLVEGIIQAESSFDPLAVHDEGQGHSSYGLMQVLDTTAEWLGLKGSPVQLLTPAVGVDYGVRYLAWQLKRYQGDIGRAVAAYNSGTAYTNAAGQYRNQNYVDRVLSAFAGFAGQAGAAAGDVARSPKSLVAVLGVAVLAFFVLSQSGKGRR